MNNVYIEAKCMYVDVQYAYFQDTGFIIYTEVKNESQN